MSNVREVLTVGGATPLTGGITQTTRNYELPGTKAKTNDLIFTEAVFGISVTHIQVPTSQRWAAEVYSTVPGHKLLIAGVTGIGTTTSTLIGISQFVGASAGAVGLNGIPMPTSVDIIGSSTAVGTTFGCVVTLALHN